MNQSELKVGDKVRVSYHGEEGILGTILQVTRYYDKKIIYGIKTVHGSMIDADQEYVRKVYTRGLVEWPKDERQDYWLSPIHKMKIKSYKMVVIPFEYVLHRVLFRYKNDWWRRVTGTDKQAERFIESDEIVPKLNKKYFQIFPNELVITGKSNLEKTIAYAFIVDEFNLPSD